MSNIESAGGLLSNFGEAEVGELDSEHALSIQVANAIHAMDQYEKFMMDRGMRLPRRYREEGAPSEEEREVIRSSVVNTYKEHIEPSEKAEEQRLREQGIKDPGIRIDTHTHRYEHEFSTVQHALRTIWHQNYYEPRSRPATSQDFGQWVEAYVDRYGKAAIDTLGLTDASFEDKYRTFAFGRGNDTDLRTAEQDILIVQGCGAYAVNTIEAPGTRVKMVLPDAASHNDIFSVEIAPKEWFFDIDVPKDTLQFIGNLAFTSKLTQQPKSLARSL